MNCSLPKSEGHPLNFLREETKYICFHNFSEKTNDSDLPCLLFLYSSTEAAQEVISRELQEDSEEKDM